MSTVAEATSTRSPWWDQYSVARLLHQAIANGAVVREWDPFGEAGEPADPWFLDVVFQSTIRVLVGYSTSDGFWRMMIDDGPLDRLEATAEDHSLAALTLGVGAKLCRDLNFATRDRTSPADVLAEEIEALIMDSDQHPGEIAAALRISNGVLSSKLTGSTKWTALELLQLARALRPHDPTAVLERLMEVSER
ncbi:hypothetical protein GCM10022200_05490 [Microbacterium awajiense]|uniref:DNA-binding protein n=2 Tax=Microbacterium awajiense TaxID=415214 RepID=A0ABP7A710_9MICO